MSSLKYTDKELKQKMRLEYVLERASVSDLSKKYGIPVGTVRSFAYKEGWTKERDKIAEESLRLAESRYKDEKEKYEEYLALVITALPEQAMKVIKSIDMILEDNEKYYLNRKNCSNTYQAETCKLGIRDLSDIVGIHKLIKDVYNIEFTKSDKEDNTWVVQFVGLDDYPEAGG